MDWSAIAVAMLLIGSMVVSSFVLTDNTFDPAYLIRHITLLLSIAFSAGWLFLLSKERINIANTLFEERKNPFVIAFFAYILVKVVSVSVAINSVEAFFDILSSIACLLFFLFLATLIRYRELNKQQLIRIPLVLNGMLIIFALFAFALVGMDWDKLGEVGSSMINPNLFAPMFLLCIPFLLIYSHNHRYKTLLWAVIAIDLLLIIALQNRATYLALGVGLLAYGGAYIFTQKNKVVKVVYTTLVGVSLIRAVYVSSNYKNYWQILTDNTVEIHDNYNSTTERLQLWNRSVLLFKDNPALGIGAGNWPLRVTEYGITDPYSDRGSKYFLRPHNELLRVLSEMGLLGFLAAGVFVFLVIRELVRRLRYPENKNEGLALTFGFAGFAVIALLSFPTERVPLMVLVLSMLALLGGRHKEVKEKKVGFLLPVLAISALVLTIVFYQRMENDAIAKKMDDARNRKQWDKVMRYNEEINVTIYNVNYFKVPMGFYSGLVYYYRQQIEAAKAEFNNALTANPNHILTLTNLATCYQQSGDLDSAIYYFDKALRVNPNFEMAKQNLAIAYYNGKKIEEAWQVLLNCKNPPVNLKNAITRGYLILLLNSNNTDEALKKKIQLVYNQEKWLLQIYNEAKKGLSLKEILREI